MLKNATSLIGEPPISVLAALTPDLPPGTRFEVRRVPVAPPLQARAPIDDSEVFERAKTLSHEQGIPFWHSVFRLFAQSSEGVPAEVIEAAAFSQPTRHRSVLVPDDALPAQLADLEESRPDGELLLLASFVTLADGREVHLPLLDFSVKQRWQGAQVTAARIATALGVRGALLASGRSYHFIGFNLLSWDEYRDFLAHALLFTPMVDERWIAHQLRASQSTLRLSANRDGVTPRVVAIIEPEAPDEPR